MLILENEIYQDNDINEIDFRKNSRELILSKLEDAIEYLHKKSLKGHIQNKENEKVRIQWFKALSHACSIYNQISRDSDLDDLRKEFDDFKKMMKWVNG